MTDYSNWKMLKSESDEKEDEYSKVSAWCDDNNYQIKETELYYEVQPALAPLPPTHEEIRQQRIAYRRGHIDDQTIERFRKQANKTWTDDDETAYLALDAEVTTWIEENLPYPDEV